MRFLLAFFMLLPAALYAAPVCPLIDGKYLDIQCDGKLTFLALGDSITQGVHDDYATTINGQPVSFVNYGGYPARLEKYFEHTPSTKVITMGFAGQSCKEIWVKFRIELLKKKSKISFVDMGVLLCGINDYEDTPETKYSRDYIVKIQRLAKRNAMKMYLGDLLPVLIEKEISWRNSLNALLAPLVNIPFRFMPESLLGSDGLHPSPQGYDYMFGLVRDEIEATFGKEDQHSTIWKSLGLNTDADGDGLPDKIEKKYHTDRNNPDTDGDSVPDLDEIIAGTSPRKPNV